MGINQGAKQHWKKDRGRKGKKLEEKEK
jgi:hypothetical protein